ncbi:LysM peptidoglycan-binding domain-containing protein [Hymenobacter sp. GOD-10R]|uniref:LysM peptidoglycan-binding domain-containing protein n=1 Tax=Hymenobacter sp. GOD-10R TaxID=3093922 RepID=UPI002D7A2B8D|nr:LysM peptidoglycan-binding domain-containing protein [Hymenobacter sp. GOD-10R]WRQ30615.1 LysM peptidoglycan-binding domain-containing protein [Hymenobacter sp. GOD-10R]
MTRFLVLVTASFFAGFAALATPRPIALVDSIGVIYQNNKILIKHRVKAGETLYGISRRYKVPVDQIVEANPKVQGALFSGQVVLVPRTRVVLTNPAPTATRPAPANRPATVSAAPKPATPTGGTGLQTDARGNQVYVVEKGQTLFSTARRFNMAPAELARINQLPADYGVRVGQTLIIVPAGGAAPSAKPAVEPTAAAAPKTTPAPSSPATVLAERPEATDRDKETNADAATPPTTAEDRAPDRASEIVHRVRENGLAATIEGAVTDKYLALHKTAPVGTIMQVRNIMNGQSVYVRVIGQLPDTGENSTILVRLSPRAVQRLSMPNSRFRVETSYVP